MRQSNYIGINSNRRVSTAYRATNVPNVVVDGKQGPIGPAGIPGQTGPRGPQGERGSQGPQGEQGEQGDNIAKWNGTSWSQLGNGLNGQVNALVFDNNNNLYAGGSFTTAGGISANRIRYWHGWYCFCFSI